MHLDTSFNDVQQDPGFQRRLVSEIATALRIPHQCIRVAAVEEQGAYAAVHLVLSDCDGGHKPAGGGLAQQSTSPRPNEGSGAKGSQMTLRLADELATDLWRQSQVADSQLKRGKCRGIARRRLLASVVTVPARVTRSAPYLKCDVGLMFYVCARSHNAGSCAEHVSLVEILPSAKAARRAGGAVGASEDKNNVHTDARASMPGLSTAIWSSPDKPVSGKDGRSGTGLRFSTTPGDCARERGAASRSVGESGKRARDKSATRSPVTPRLNGEGRAGMELADAYSSPRGTYRFVNGSQISIPRGPRLEPSLNQQGPLHAGMDAEAGGGRGSRWLVRDGEDQMYWDGKGTTSRGKESGGREGASSTDVERLLQEVARLNQANTALQHELDMAKCEHATLSFDEGASGSATMKTWNGFSGAPSNGTLQAITKDNSKTTGSRGGTSHAHSRVQSRGGIEKMRMQNAHEDANMVAGTSRVRSRPPQNREPQSRSPDHGKLAPLPRTLVNSRELQGRDVRGAESGQEGTGAGVGQVQGGDASSECSEKDEAVWTQEKSWSVGQSSLALMAMEKKMHVMVVAQTAVAMITVLLAVIAHEMYLEELHAETKRPFYHSLNMRLKWSQTLMTILLIVIVLAYKVLQYHWNMGRKVYQDPRVKYRTAVGVLAELAVLFVHPAPFLDSCYICQHNTVRLGSPKGDHPYTIETLLSFFVLMRVYVLARFFRTYMVNMHIKAKVLSLTHSDVQLDTTMFWLKFALDNSPVWGYIILCSVFLFWASYMIRLAEAGQHGASIEDFNLYTNCLWYIVVTATTTGYGDLAPETTIGR